MTLSKMNMMTFKRRRNFQTILHATNLTRKLTANSVWLGVVHTLQLRCSVCILIEHENFSLFKKLGLFNYDFAKLEKWFLGVLLRRLNWAHILQLKLKMLWKAPLGKWNECLALPQVMEYCVKQWFREMKRA